MNSIYDKWNKLTQAQQAAIKAEAQKKIAEGYDPKKIEEHISNNFGNSNL